MEMKPIAVSPVSGKQGYTSVGDLWSWPYKPGTGSGDFTRAGMTSNDGHTGSSHDSPSASFNYWWRQAVRL